MATDVNDFVMLPISKRSAGVTFAPAFGYSVVPAASAQSHSDDSATPFLCFPGEGRDPPLPWAPAFAGEAGLSGVLHGRLNRVNESEH
jgi:hypothetical protein